MLGRKLQTTVPSSSQSVESSGATPRQQQHLPRTPAASINPWVPLAPPHYTLDPEHFLHSSVSRTAWYMTTLYHIPQSSLKPQSRSYLLNLLEHFPRGTIGSSATAVQVVVTGREVILHPMNPSDPSLALVQRISMPHLHTLSYVREQPERHLLFVVHEPSTNHSSGWNSRRPSHPNSVHSRTHSSPLEFNGGLEDITGLLNVTVLMCDSRLVAEELSAVVRQAMRCCATHFYTPAATTAPPAKPPLPTSPHPTSFKSLNKPILIPGTPHSRSSPSPQSTLSSVASRSTAITFKQEKETDVGGALLKEYLALLRRELQADELRKYVTLLECWQKHLLNFQEFCRNLVHVVGPSRMHLVWQMQEFLPPAEQEELSRYLSRHSNGPSAGNTVSSVFTDFTATLVQQGNNPHQAVTSRTFNKLGDDDLVSNWSVDSGSAYSQDELQGKTVNDVEQPAVYLGW